MRDREEGFALVAAVFVLAVVVGLSLDAAVRARSERQMAWNLAVEVRARAAARGGLALALLRLRALQARTVSATGSDPDLFGAWNRIDTLGASTGERDLPGGEHYRFEVRDVASRLSINTATAEEFRDLFTALGVADGVAAAAGEEIVDRRDREGPYTSIEGVFQAEGTESLPGDVRAFLTLSGDGHVNLNTAPAPVLRALPGMSDEAVASVLARRERGDFLRNLFALPTDLGPEAREEIQRHYADLARTASFEPSLLEITVTGRVDGARMRAPLVAIGVRAGSTIQLVSSAEE
ncbi:MAG TPA: type II secretion system protein GspK [Longimicrobiaceae bacterium]|nr:type II secretion system protein GspK [Longimicrobiaceae bacterium]